MMFYRLIAARKENSYIDAKTKQKVVFWPASETPIVRFESLSQKETENYGRDIYQDEGIIAEIFEVDGR